MPSWGKYQCIYLFQLGFLRFSTQFNINVVCFFSTLLMAQFSNVMSAIVTLMTVTNECILEKTQINSSFSILSAIAHYSYFLLLKYLFSSLQHQTWARSRLPGDEMSSKNFKNSCFKSRWPWNSGQKSSRLRELFRKSRAI